MKVSSKISLLHFLEVNRKTRNNIGNKSWRILDMAWVQRHMSAEGKKQSKSEVWCKAKRNTYPKRREELKPIDLAEHSLKIQIERKKR